MYAGGAGACFLAGAFYPWITLLGVACVVAMFVRTYLSDLKRAKEQRELEAERAERAKEQKVLGSVVASVESDPAAKAAVKAGMKQRGMATPEFRAVVDEAKRKEGV